MRPHVQTSESSKLCKVTFAWNVTFSRTSAYLTMLPLTDGHEATLTSWTLLVFWMQTLHVG